MKQMFYCHCCNKQFKVIGPSLKDVKSSLEEHEKQVHSGKPTGAYGISNVEISNVEDI